MPYVHNDPVNYSDRVGLAPSGPAGRNSAPLAEADIIDKLPDAIPSVTYLKFLYYDRLCAKESTQCAAHYNLSNMTDDQIAEAGTNCGANPAYRQCFEKNPNCKKALKYAIDLGTESYKPPEFTKAGE
ncbi:MAG TPA: hypothetical protein VGJ81_13780 [Thermoanaerobaculia bacterium]|jgi:hypothetical protein